MNNWEIVIPVVDYGIKIAAIGLVPEGRRPSSSTAWLLIILLVPIVGLPLFLLMGSPYIDRRRHRIQQEASDQIEDIQADIPDYPEGMTLNSSVESFVHLNRQLTQMPAVTGYCRGLIGDYTRILQRMEQRIDAAQSFVHLETYILAWDDATDGVLRALQRAASRGVEVRVLFDQVGSLKYPGYFTLGKRLRRAGINYRLMLPLAPWRLRWRRPDLRNHRKLLVVDGTVAFMGSQNLIERSYLLCKNKKEGRQWVDAMAELTGPIVDSINMLFAVDWFTESDEVLEYAAPQGTLPTPLDDADSTNVLQLIPSGPGFTTEPNLRMFNSLVYNATEQIIICSPYFIPDESLLEAITTASYRGVEVILLVSEQGDQLMVHHAQSAYYQTLLEAGVRIFQFPKPYVLHTKFLLADPGTEHCLGAFGSSNLDMRSFGLNYEMTLLALRGSLKGELNELANNYLAVSKELTMERWEKRSLLRRYFDNAMKLTSALQ